MRVSAADVRALKAKNTAPVIVKQPGQIIAVFVPGALVNPLNATAWSWRKRSTVAKQWKLRTASAMFEAEYRGSGVVGVNVGWALLMLEMEPQKPKLVRFRARVHNKFDGDGLQAALKPVRDALVTCRVISGDADKDGHVFVYEQVIDRTHRGVEIVVEPRAEAS